LYFLFYNPTDNSGVSADGTVFIMADFGEASCSVLLTILATYYGNAFWWMKADLYHVGGHT
jgi:hypothetical protein